MGGNGLLRPNSQHNTQHCSVIVLLVWRREYLEQSVASKLHLGLAPVIRDPGTDGYHRRTPEFVAIERAFELRARFTTTITTSTDERLAHGLRRRGARRRGGGLLLRRRLLVRVLRLEAARHGAARASLALGHEHALLLLLLLLLLLHVPLRHHHHGAARAAARAAHGAAGATLGHHHAARPHHDIVRHATRHLPRVERSLLPARAARAAARAALLLLLLVRHLLLVLRLLHHHVLLLRLLLLLRGELLLLRGKAARAALHRHAPGLALAALAALPALPTLPALLGGGTLLLATLRRRLLLLLDIRGRRVGGGRARLGGAAGTWEARRATGTREGQGE